MSEHENVGTLTEKTATVTTAYGNTLDKPIKFKFSFMELGDTDEVPEDERPDEKELRSWVNQNRAATSRSKAQATALKLAGIEKPTLEDEAFQITTMKKVFMAQKNADGSLRYSSETAEVAARAALGLS